MPPEKNYRHIWREKRSLINVESHLRMYTEQRDMLGNTHNNSFIYARDGVAEEFHHDADNQQWVELGRSFLNKEFVDQLFKEGEAIRNHFKEFLQQLSETDISSLNAHILTELFRQSYQFHSRLRSLFKTTRSEFLTIAEKELRILLLQTFKNEKEAAEKFQLLTTPFELDDVNKEAIAWTNLLSEKELAQEALHNHILTYPWLVAHTFDEAQIMSELTAKHSTESPHLNVHRQALEATQKQKHMLLNKQQELLIKLGDEKISYLSWLFQECSLERMRLKGGWSGSDYLYLPAYKEIAKRTAIPLEKLYSFYRIDETINALEMNHPTISSEEIENRKKAYVLWLQNGHIHFYSGSEAETIIEQELHHIQKKEDNFGLQGRVACLGKACGKVRIVIPGDITMLIQAISQFQQGEILVTTMTQPNMVPLMKKAAAIITDEGGLTSHAAIIAREFGIPCIVGTEIATKIFKDGDLVEVDAEKGTVRKIK